MNLTSSKLKSFGDISLLAQNTAQLSDSSGKDGQFTAIAAGNLSIQGNAGINIQLSNNPLSILKGDGNITLVSDGVITGNTRFKSGGTFSTQNLAGGLGNFKSDPTLINLNGDPYQTLISSIGDVNFGNYEGLALKVESQGSITGGNVKITGFNPTLTTGSDPDIAILTNGNTAYWSERNSKLYFGETSKALKKQNHRCASCGLKFIDEERIHLHHIDGNHVNWKKNNLEAIHESCHDYKHMSKSAKLRTSEAGCGESRTPRFN